MALYAVDKDGNKITVAGGIGPRGPKGDPGETGAQGPQGETGAAGPGVPDGGAAGQVLAKKTAANQDTEWTILTAAAISLTPPSGMTATNVQEAVSELFQSVSEGKALIASAVTDKGVETPADATFQTMRNNILAIPTGSLPDNVRTITLTADPLEGGTVAGGGLTSVGMKVTVTATPKSGFDFVDWLEDDIYVTDHNTGAYTFSVD